VNDIDFHADDLVALVEALDTAALDRLPFGAVKLDETGKVVVFSGSEQRLSGYDLGDPLGLDFFKEVAPCLNTPAYGQRLEAARKAGQVDIEIGWIGDFNDRNRQLDVRLLSAGDGGIWIFTQRNE
jgi:photoactive yellow protein